MRRLNAEQWLKNYNIEETSRSMIFNIPTRRHTTEELMEGYADYKYKDIEQNKLSWVMVFTDTRKINIVNNQPFKKILIHEEVKFFLENICNIFYKNNLEKWYKINDLEFQLQPNI